MNTNRIFIGTIMKDDKEIGTSVFIKFKDEYILLNDISGIFDLFNKKNNLRRFKTAIINTNLNSTKNTYYIDKNSLTPYYDKKRYKSLKKIKFDYMLDSRNPMGLNY